MLIGLNQTTTTSLGHSSSSASITALKYPQPTLRIADQVIEEVDEQQQTIQSMRGSDKRPTAQSIFAHQQHQQQQQEENQPIRSSPIDVPSSYHNSDTISYERVQSVMQPEHHPYVFPNNTIFSSSAPEENGSHLRNATPKINVDHFDDLNDVQMQTPKQNDKQRKLSNEFDHLKFLFLKI